MVTTAALVRAAADAAARGVVVVVVMMVVLVVVTVTSRTGRVGRYGSHLVVVVMVVVMCTGTCPPTHFRRTSAHVGGGAHVQARVQRRRRHGLSSPSRLGV